MLKLRSFDICKNTVVPMIAMLDCSEINIEVSNSGVETAESDDYREMSEDDGDTNGMLTIM